jgi:ribosomal protein L11 methylase PrmA
MAAPLPADAPAPVSAAQSSGDRAVERDPGSFRDPGGFVYRRDGVLLRQVGPTLVDDWQSFASSGLAAKLVADGRLISWDTAPLELAATTDARAVIKPEPIEFISYPYEWTFGELRDAALLTLDVQLQALDAGWTLRDATAYNVQFRAGRPILIDLLSLEPHEDGAPWVAYRQFCEHFLAPLALMARRDIRLATLLRADPDGVPLDLATHLLPWRSRLNFGLLSHLYLHASAQTRHAGNEDEGAAARGARISRTRLKALVQSLRNTVSGLDWKPSGTEWADYADHTSYSDRGTAAKEQLVAQFVTAAGGRTVWDLGANTGRYSRVAAGVGRSVLAFDIDPAAAERNYRSLAQEGRTDILPLVMDLANPSPGVGWASRERRSLLDRANADVTLSLALVHHLAISRNVPLPMFVELLASIAPTAIVEFVPKEDPMVRRLLASRRDVFPEYTVDGFRAAARTRFSIAEEAPIQDSGRVLFLLRG